MKEILTPPPPIETIDRIGQFKRVLHTQRQIRENYVPGIPLLLTDTDHGTHLIVDSPQQVKAINGMAFGVWTEMRQAGFRDVADILIKEDREGLTPVAMTPGVDYKPTQ